MPVLFASTADLSAPGLYRSIASRYILRAIMMSPRISGVRFGAGGAAGSLAWNANPVRKTRETAGNMLLSSALFYFITAGEKLALQAGCDDLRQAQAAVV